MIETKRQQTISAFKEAVADTALASIVNIPLNFVLVYLCIEIWGLGPGGVSTVLITVFTIFAITRKTYVRMYFEDRKNRKKLKESD